MGSPSIGSWGNSPALRAKAVETRRINRETRERARRRRPQLDEKNPNPNSRGMRALRTVCKQLGVRPSKVTTLRGEEGRRFHYAWTDEMKRLARAEGEWNPDWDRRDLTPATRAHWSTVHTHTHDDDDETLDR